MCGEIPSWTPTSYASARANAEEQMKVFDEAFGLILDYRESMKFIKADIAGNQNKLKTAVEMSIQNKLEKGNVPPPFAKVLSTFLDEDKQTWATLMRARNDKAQRGSSQDKYPVAFDVVKENDAAGKPENRANNDMYKFTDDIAKECGNFISLAADAIAAEEKPESPQAVACVDLKTALPTQHVFKQDADYDKNAPIVSILTCQYPWSMNLEAENTPMAGAPGVAHGGDVSANPETLVSPSSKSIISISNVCVLFHVHGHTRPTSSMQTKTHNFDVDLIPSAGVRKLRALRGSVLELYASNRRTECDTRGCSGCLR